jgi:hypothetical protein
MGAGLLVFCADYRCSHSLAISGDYWPDDVRLSDIEPRFICAACGHRGADVRPDFNWNRQTVAMMGYRRRGTGRQLKPASHTIVRPISASRQEVEMANHKSMRFIARRCCVVLIRSIQL